MALIASDGSTAGSVRAFQVTGAVGGAVGDEGTELNAGLVKSICRSWPNLATEVNYAAVCWLLGGSFLAVAGAVRRC